jgi:vacuolar-type H+-ATPase subunit I/STV1
MAFIKAEALKTLKDDLTSLKKENQRLTELLEQSEQVRKETEKQLDESLRALSERDEAIQRWESLSHVLNDELDTGFASFALLERSEGSISLNLSAIQEFRPIYQTKGTRTIEVGCLVNGEHEIYLTTRQLHWVIAKKKQGAPLADIQAAIREAETKKMTSTG